MSRRRVLSLLAMFLILVVGGFLAGKALASSEFVMGLGSLALGAGGQASPTTPGSSSGQPTSGRPKDPGTAAPSPDLPAGPGSKVDTGFSGEPGQGQGNAGNEGDKPIYWIDVDVTTQMVRIMQGEEVVKEMLASTGVEGHETPLGTFEIQNRGPWFFSEKYQQGAKYWVSFKDWGIYLFHSLAMDKDQQIIEEEAAKLGEPASHGCVRLLVEDAKWIYDNIVARTKVVIHE